jgi:membrane associated rhomboid family serine protease
MSYGQLVEIRAHAIYVIGTWGLWIGVALIAAGLIALVLSCAMKNDPPSDKEILVGVLGTVFALFGLAIALAGQYHRENSGIIAAAALTKSKALEVVVHEH